MGSNGYGIFVGDHSLRTHKEGQCEHGTYKCPNDETSCVKATCVCDMDWEGEHCDQKKPPCEQKICLHDQMFDAESCGCKCASPWAGDVCEKCEEKSCPGQMSPDASKGCECSCPSDLCGDHGALNRISCECKCSGSWHGDRCEKCAPRRCANGGIFNTRTCMCDCMPPWEPKDDCMTCPFLDCQNGGTMDYDSCQCKCTGAWTGELCDSCPSFEELVMAGLDCGESGFNSETCSCRGVCSSDLTCAHGATAVGTGKDCKCNCDTIENHVAESDNGFAGASFWSGEDCNSCPSQARNNCEKVSLSFDKENCACTSDKNGPCSINAEDCEHGSTYDKENCRCECPDGYVGRTCSVAADDAKLGTSKDLPAKSCKEIRHKNSNAESGKYWLEGSGNNSPVEVMCDMDQNGGGWALLANIGMDLATSLLEKETYENGIGNSSSEESFVLPCENFDTGDDKVEIRVSMGAVRDYFKPIPGETLCSMLGSNSKHLWSPSDSSPEALSQLREFMCGEDNEVNTENCKLPPFESAFIELKEDVSHRRFRLRRLLMDGDEEEENKQEEEEDAPSLGGGDEEVDNSDETEVRELTAARWYQPKYIDNEKLKGVLGGSAMKWTKDIDGRQYISFWGGDKGGCCHEASLLYKGPGQDGADVGTWARQFKLHVRPL